MFYNQYSLLSFFRIQSHFLQVVTESTSDLAEFGLIRRRIIDFLIKMLKKVLRLATISPKTALLPHRQRRVREGCDFQESVGVNICRP